MSMQQNGFRDPESVPGLVDVYQLHHTQSARVFYSEGQDGDLVVVKQFIGEQDSESRRRFTLEAQTLGELDHPQIPKLLEDNTDHFYPHFIMEAVRDPLDMAKFFAHNSSPLLASRIIHSILGPIGYIHDKNLVHRDIKTDNIIGRRIGRPVLSDFGIAAPLVETQVPVAQSDRLWFEEEDEDSQGHETLDSAKTGLTATLQVVGTPEFMSPEQAGNLPVDRTTDIYGLGITYYYLLYGKLPFVTEAGLNSNSSPGEIRHPSDLIVDLVIPEKQRRFAELARQHIGNDIDFTAPQGRDVPEPLITVIEKATQKDPVKRYKSAFEMREEVERSIALVSDSPASLAA